jgi:hypothetical protein
LVIVITVLPLHKEKGFSTDSFAGGGDWDPAAVRLAGLHLRASLAYLLLGACKIKMRQY